MRNPFWTTHRVIDDDHHYLQIWLRQMNRPNRFKLILFVVTSGLWAGCESSSFAPPRPPELDARTAGGTNRAEAIRPPGDIKADDSGPDGRSLASDSTPTPRIRGIDLILTRPNTIDREYLTQIVRKEAGKRMLSFRLTKPEPGEPTSAAWMARAIRKAAELRYAVILEPLDAPEVCEALRMFQTTGLGILLLDDPHSCPGPSVSTHRIRFTGFSDCGEAIVRTALEEATVQELPADQSIAIVRNRLTDAYSSQRQDSVTDALKMRKRLFDIVEFEGSQSEAHLRLIDYLKTHPKRPIVLALDHPGLLGAYKAHAELSTQKRPAFVLAGYALSDVRTGFPGHTACVGFAYQDLDVYSRKAAEIVVSLSNGKSVPLMFESELPFIRTRSDVGPGPGVEKSRSR
jgi:ABC-type sugar transport system substrate-binding protein